MVVFLFLMALAIGAIVFLAAFLGSFLGTYLRPFVAVTDLKIESVSDGPETLPSRSLPLKRQRAV